MSEYWKSTPKYWCKFCKTYVRDTPLERQQHEATGRHQGNIQRSLRSLHKEREREGRETERAKNEVARLNGIVSGKSSSGGGAAPTSSHNKPTFAASAPPRQATQEDRKQQMAQLASMGISVPEEFRRDMAMVGEWKTVSEKHIEATQVKDEDVKVDVKSIGVHKRKREGEDDDEDAAAGVIRKSWGSTYKSYPGAQTEAEDIAALIGSQPSKREPSDNTQRELHIKKEDEDERDVEDNKASTANDPDLEAQVKNDPDQVEAPVVFKKRKGKTAKVG